jgi:ribosomal protein L14E/L6E/L27E
MYDHKDAEPNVRPFRNGPDEGWGHFLAMRLGKTPLALNESMLFNKHYSLDTMVAVCPNSFKNGWATEAEKSGFDRPWVIYETSNAAQALREYKAAKGACGISINYEALKQDKTKAFFDEVDMSRVYLVLDESIKTKNPNSLQSKAARDLASQAGVVRCLTGLPMTQGPHDLYAQLRAIRRFNGKNFFSFRNRFCKMGGFKGKKVVGSRNEEELQGYLDSCSFLAKRAQWGRSIGEDYHIEGLRMTSAMAKLYKEMDEDLIAYLDSGEVVSADLVLTKLGKLAQISSGFVYVDGECRMIEDPRKTPKMEKLIDMLEETSEKMVVVYNYKPSGNALMEVLQKYEPTCIRSSEWMKKNDRDPETEKKRFNHSRSSRVMLLQTTSGKYGHDLTGTVDDRCSRMVFYEGTYSLDDRIQIEARVQTAYQNWPNDYHDFVCSPIEGQAIKAIQAKEDVAEAVIGRFRGSSNVAH